MFISLILFTACKVDRPEKTTVSADVQTQPSQQPQNQSKTSSEKSSPTKDGLANVNISSEAVQIQLPSLTPQTGTGQYCYLQEMPTTADVGMTGLQFFAGNKVDFISVKGVRADSTQAERGRWMDCGEFAGEDTTVPLYEVVGVDLADSNGELFDGFHWIALPDKTAFKFPVTDLWLFEVQVPGNIQDKFDVSVSVSTMPKAAVEQWAGILEFKMGSFQKGTYESTCTLPEALNVLSVFGHSEPAVGTWELSCGDDKLLSVDSEKFAGDIPPLANFKTPKSIEAGSTCSIACDWGDKTTGQMCEGVVVVTSIDSPMACIDGEIRQ